MFIYLTRAVPEVAIDLLANALPDARIEVNPHDRNLNRAELIEAAAGCAVGLLPAWGRRMTEDDTLTRQGLLTGWAPLLDRGHGVDGKTVGIVGAGRIGKRVAATMKHGFGGRILYHSRE